MSEHPPNPLRHVNLGCNTTPHGTPIPRGPPPPDAGLRDLGSVGSLPRVPGFPLAAQSGLSLGQVGFGAVAGSCIDVGPQSDRPSIQGCYARGDLGSMGDQRYRGLTNVGAQLLQPTGVPTMQHSNQGEFSGPGYSPSGNAADPESDPWGGGVPTVGDGGRDPYAPGDRVYWSLPVLHPSGCSH